MQTFLWPDRKLNHHDNIRRLMLFQGGRKTNTLNNHSFSSVLLYIEYVIYNNKYRLLGTTIKWYINVQHTINRPAIYQWSGNRGGVTAPPPPPPPQQWVVSWISFTATCFILWRMVSSPTFSTEWPPQPFNCSYSTVYEWTKLRASAVYS